MADAARAKNALLVGLISFQDGETIGPVVAAARAALTGHFGDLAGRIVLADCGSTDGTVARAREAFPARLGRCGPSWRPHATWNHEPA
jgi:hypothetical protein